MRPKSSHANATQKFPRFPRFPLVTPWATFQAREYCLASQSIIATFGCSDASICQFLRRCVCECLRHNIPSISLWCVESLVNATPKSSHANATQKFPRFPRFPLVTPWATFQAREYCLASQSIIATFGCSDASICQFLRRCVCECLRHNIPSISLWLPLCPGKARRASVPSALAHSKKCFTAR
jgi:hypothetical protein